MESPKLDTYNVDNNDPIKEINDVSTAQHRFADPATVSKEASEFFDNYDTDPLSTQADKATRLAERSAEKRRKFAEDKVAEQRRRDMLWDFQFGAQVLEGAGEVGARSTVSLAELKASGLTDLIPEEGVAAFNSIQEWHAGVQQELAKYDSVIAEQEAYLAQGLITPDIAQQRINNVLANKKREFDKLYEETYPKAADELLKQPVGDLAKIKNAEMAKLAESNPYMSGRAIHADAFKMNESRSAYELIEDATGARLWGHEVAKTTRDYWDTRADQTARNELGEDIETNTQDAKVNFQEAAEAYRAGEYGKGAVDAIKGLWTISKGVAKAGVDNPKGVFDYTLEESYDLLLGAGLGKGALAAIEATHAGEIYSNAIAEYQNNNGGKLPDTETLQKIATVSIASGAAEYLGDITLLKALPRSVRKTFTEVSPNTAVTALQKVATAGGSLAKTSVTEGATEAVQTVIEGYTEGQITSDEKTRTSEGLLKDLANNADFNEVVKSFGIGALVGEAIATPGAAIDVATAPLAAAQAKAEKQQQVNRERKERIDSALAQRDLNQLTDNDEKIDFITKVSNENLSSEDTAKIAGDLLESGLLDDLNNENIRLTNEINELEGKEKLSSKEVKQLKSLRAQKEKVETKYSLVMSSFSKINGVEDDVASQVDDAIEQVQYADTDEELQEVTNTIFGSGPFQSVRINQLSAEQVSRVREALGDDFFDEGQSALLDQAEARSALTETYAKKAEKSSGQVNQEVLKGGPGFKGIEQYENDVALAAQQGDINKAEKELSQLKKFTDSHKSKLEALQKAVRLLDSKQPVPAELSDFLAKTALGGKSVTDFTDNGTRNGGIVNIMNTVASEVKALETTATALNYIIGDSVGTSEKPSKTSEPDQAPKSTESTTEEPSEASTEATTSREPTDNRSKQIEGVRSKFTGTDGSIDFDQLNSEAKVKAFLQNAYRVARSALKSGVEPELLNNIQALYESSVFKQLLDQQGNEDTANSIQSSFDELFRVESSEETQTSNEGTPNWSLENEFSQIRNHDPDSAESPGSLNRLSVDGVKTHNFVSKWGKLASAKSEVGRILHRIPRIFEKNDAGQFVRGAELLTELQKIDKHGATQERKTSLEEIGKLHDQVKVLLNSLISNEERNYQNLFNEFRKEDGTFIDGISETATLTIYELVVNNLAGWNGATAYDTAKSLGISNKDDVTPAQIAMMSEIGFTKTYMAELLGKNFLQNLGYQISKDAPIDFESKLVSHIGTSLIGIMGAVSENGQQIFTRHEIPKVIYEKVVNGEITTAKEMSAEVKKYEATDIKERDNTTVLSIYPLKNDFVSSLAQSNKKTQGMLNKLFGIQYTREDPTFEAQELKQRQRKNTKDSVSKRQKKAVEAYQSQPLKVKKKNLAVWKQLSSDQKKELLGYQDPASLHVYLRDSQEGKNTQILNSIEAFDEFIESMPSEDTEFYVTSEIWKQLRMGMDTKGVNTQGDKFHRHMVSHVSHEVTAEVSNPVDFFLALGDAFDFKLDKNHNSTVIDKVLETLQEPELKEAVALAAKEDLTKEESNRLVKLIDSLPGDNYYTMDAVMNLVDYFDAITDPERDTFTHNLFREVDGVTNGPAIGMLQLGMGTNREFMNRTGMFFEGDKEQNFEDYITSEGNLDSYENLGLDWFNNLNATKNFSEAMLNNWDAYQIDEKYELLNLGIPKSQFDELPFEKKRALVSQRKAALNALRRISADWSAVTYEEKYDFVNGKPTKAIRNISKNPLMVFVYGSGPSGIKRSIGEEFLKSFYESIAEIEGAKKISEQEKDRRVKVLLSMAKDIAGIDNIGINYKPGDFSGLLEQEMSPFATQQFIRNASNIMGNPMIKGIESNYDALIKTRAKLNNIVNEASLRYIALREIMIEQRRKEMVEEGLLPSVAWENKNGEKGETILFDLPKSELDKIDELIKDMEPKVHNFFSQETGNVDEAMSLLKKSKLSQALGKQDNSFGPLVRTASSSVKFTEKVPGLSFKNLKKKGENKTDYAKELTADVHIERKLEEPGVAPMVLMIHSLDASVMTLMMERLAEYGHAFTNVHDAGIFMAENASQYGQLFNEIFYEVMSKYSVSGAVAEMYQRTSQAEARIRTRLSPEMMTAFEERFESLTEELKKFMDEFDSEAFDEFVAKNPSTRMKEVVATAVQSDANRIKALNEMTSVDQYHINDGQFDVSDRTVDYTPQFKKVVDKALRQDLKGDKAFKDLVRKLVREGKLKKEPTEEILKSIGTAIPKGTSVKDALNVVTQAIKQNDEIRQKAKRALGDANPEIDLNSTFFSQHGDVYGPDFIASFDDQHIEIAAQDTLGVFDSLGQRDQIEESPEHRSLLRQKLSAAVELMENQVFKLHRQETIEKESFGMIDGQSIYLMQEVNSPERSRMLATGLNMSAQEILVHEMYHALTSNSLNDLDNKTARAIAKVHDFVGRNLKVEDLIDPLLVPGSQEYDAEMERAERMMEHMGFGTSVEYIKVKQKDPVSGRISYLKIPKGVHEFLAFTQTNARMRDVLAKHDMNQNFKPYRSIKGNSLLETLDNIVHRIIDLMLGKFGAFSRDATVTSQMDKLVRQMTMVEKRQKSNLLVAAEVGLGLPRQIISYSLKGARKAAGAVYRNTPLKNSGVNTIRAIGSLTGLASEYTPGSLEELSKEAENQIMKVQSNTALSLHNEVVGTTNRNKELHELNRESNHIVDQERKHANSLIVKRLQAAFGDMSTSLKEKITRVVLRTDMSSLADVYSQEQMIELLNDSGFLENEISKLEGTIKALPYGNYYHRMSRSLANYMVFGKALEPGQQLNAHNIVNLGGSVRHKGPQMTAQQEQQYIRDVDTYVSLMALRLTDKQHRLAVREEFQRQIAKGEGNGYQTLIDTHRSIKQRTEQQLFRGQKYSMIKGYTKELTDPRRSIAMVASHDVEKQRELRRMGFIKQATIARDPNDPVKEGVETWVAPDYGMSTFQAGVVSPTNETSKGTLMMEVQEQVNPNMDRSEQMKLGSQADRQISRRIQNHIDSLVQGSNTQEPAFGSNGPNYTIPVMDSKGFIKANRYVMTSQNRDDYLKRNNEFDLIMGGMEGAIIDKTATRRINRKAIDYLHKIYRQDYVSKPGEFIKISPHSRNAKHREIYYMMPEDMRRYASTKFHNNEIIIRRDEVAKMFGERRLSIGDLFTKTEEDWREMNQVYAAVLKGTVEMTLKLFGEEKTVARLRKAENIWQEFIKEVKDAIVVKTGVVTAGNIMSNVMLLRSMGVPLHKAVEDIFTSWKGMLEYQDLREQRDNLVSELESLRASADIIPTRKVKSLENQIIRTDSLLSRNPVHELFEAGIMQSIVEDVESDFTEFSYKGHLQEKFEKVTDKLPNTMKEGIKFMYMAHDTKLYKALNNAVKASDFTARYALYKHLTERTEEPMNKRDALSKIVDTFIDYDLPTHRLIQYGNDMGLLWFTKYFLRVQKVIINTVKENPADALTVMLMQDVLGVDSPDIFESFFLDFDNVINRVGSPLDGLSAMADILTVEAAQKVL